jgi:hypothetical protein
VAWNGRCGYEPPRGVAAGSNSRLCQQRSLLAVGFRLIDDQNDFAFRVALLAEFLCLCRCSKREGLFHLHF